MCFNVQYRSFPNIHAKDCKQIDFYVVLDLAVWNLKPGDVFTVSVISKELNDTRALFGNFQWFVTVYYNIVVYKKHFSASINQKTISSYFIANYQFLLFFVCKKTIKCFDTSMLSS